MNEPTLPEKKNLQALLLDDDEDILALLSSSLEPLGFTSITSQNGSEALQLVQEHHIDLIISDLLIPDFNGLSFIRQILKQPNPPPIIVISGAMNYESVNTLISLGITEIIAKPFEEKTLQNSIQKILLKDSPS